MMPKLTLAPVWVDRIKCWTVQDGDGRRISGVYATQREAESRRDVLIEANRKKHQSRKRPCMCCAKTFVSEGIHNRLCATCRHGGGPTTHW